MEGTELFTLKEISELLGVKYRALIGCKNYFSELMSGVFDGRHDRYSVEMMHFFDKVFQLKQQGYTFELVRQILIQQGYLDDSGKLTSKIKEELTQDDEGGGKMMKDDEGRGRRITEDEGGCRTRNDDAGRGMRIADEEGRGSRITDDEGAPGITEEEAGGDWTTQEEGELPESINLSRLKEMLLPEFKVFIQEEVEGFVAKVSAQLQDHSSQAVSQMNSSFTKFYKAINSLQEGVRGIDSRLQKLEQDLGIEAQEQPELQELDLEQLQISLPGQEETARQAKEQVSLDHATLDFVRASIRDGKPDREAVSQWVQAQRKAEPGVSYGELAERLNQAGIPTLRGLEGWNRGVVRNLAVRNNGNGGWQ